MKKNKFLVKFFLIAIPLLLIWFALIGYNLKLEQNRVISNLVYNNEIRDRNTEFLIANQMDEVVENLKVIRDADEVENYFLKSTQENFNEVELMFKRVMTNKEDYDQLRLIDENGQEVIRVDNENGVTLVDKVDLQDKSQRYYFLETKVMNKNEIFISPLDLNVEEGVIELPHNPTVRFATPIFDVNNIFKGIIIINYEADYFVRLLEEHASHDEVINFWFYIINKHGKFIFKQDDSNNFSFMLEDSDHLPSKQNNLYSKQVFDENSGVIYSDIGLTTYYDVLTKTREMYPNYTERWIGVHEMDTNALFSIKAFVKEVSLLPNMAVIFLIFFSTFTYAYINDKLRNRESKLEITELIANSTNDGVLITDEQTNIIYVNTAYEDITGYTVDELIGRQPRDYKSGKQDENFYKHMWESVNQTGFWEGMLWDKKKNGILFPMKMRLIEANDKFNKKGKRYVSIFTDLTMQMSKPNGLKEISSKDGNLFVPNEDMMLQLLKQSVVDESFSFMVLNISIANYNHLVTSDSNLESGSAELFVSMLKPFIGESDFIAQTSRNVFALIIDTANIKVEFLEFVENIHKTLSKVMTINNKEIFFKSKIGVSTWPKDTNDLKRLMLNSIIALDWVSNRKSMDIAFFSESMVHELNRENEIESNLRNAIEKDEFFMVYQPQVNSMTNQVVGVEALIRWDSKKLGLVSPAIFIPVAEKSNLIVELGYWIVDRVCKDLKEMMTLSDHVIDNIRCAINLSSNQMQEGNFLEKTFSIISNTGIEFSQLELEITENFLLTNETKNLKILNALRKKGMTIAIDDFGTGYSSLSYLNTLPIDKMKIDRTFIKNYPEKDDGKLAKILVNLAETLGISVLTEGAETKEQVEFLQEIGCNIIQGYYYSKPLDKYTLVEFLKAYKKNS